MIYHIYIPSVVDWDYWSVEVGNEREDRLRHLKVGSGEVAPATIIGRQGVVGGAEVSSREKDGWTSLQAPLGVIFAIGTPHLEACSAATPSVEEHPTQPRAVLAVAGLVEVPVATGALCNTGKPLMLLLCTSLQSIITGEKIHL